MSIQFFITSYPPTNWESANSDFRIDIEKFELEFQKNWTNVLFEEKPSGTLLWNLSENESAGFFGSIQKNRQVVSFSAGNWQTFMNFVLWYRQFIDLKHPLFFSHRVLPIS